MKYIILLFLLSCGGAEPIEYAPLCEWAEDQRTKCEKEGGIWTEQTFGWDTWILFCDMGTISPIQACCECNE